MDFFYVWLRRSLYGLSPEIDAAFQQTLAPKWDHEHNDGELIDDSSRFEGDKQKSKAIYEDGMFRAFQACHKALAPDGRLVVVFAHKHPDAWETLVSAIIRAGFVVDGSWPIQTEMGNRTRALSSAALSSSVWLVCKKRPVLVWETGGQIAHRYRSDPGHRATASPSCLWGSAVGPADAFLLGLAPSHGGSSTLATSFLVPTWEAICLPMPTLSFPEYTSFDLSTCLDIISQQSHSSCPSPIYRPLRLPMLK